jgi:hypothetical protein
MKKPAVKNDVPPAPLRNTINLDIILAKTTFVNTILL